LSEAAIRTATREDLEAVLELWRIAGLREGATDSLGALTLLLEVDPEALLVAGAPGAPAGALIAAFDGWRGSFYRIAVHPEQRRRGLGRRLVREGERRLCARGAVRIDAIVSAEQLGAERFWSALGYVREGEQTRLVANFERGRLPSP
jgi:ribosomal protein S18 acetylase RimI-like enzyme